MNEKGFSPILALVSVGVVTVLLACPEVFFAMVVVVFSTIFIVGMAAFGVFLFAYSSYCVYQILREIGRVLGGGR